MKHPRITIANSDYTPAEAFCGLRDQILKLPAESGVGSHKGPVAALMETGHPAAVATLVVVADGTTSLYFSNGGGIIGAGAHAPVRKAAALMLQSLAEASDRMEPASNFPLPRRGQVRFYVLSAEGARTVEGREQDMGYNRHKFSPLFHLAHGVITAIRQNTSTPK